MDDEQRKHQEILDRVQKYDHPAEWHWQENGQARLDVGWVDALGKLQGAQTGHRLTAAEMKDADSLILRLPRWNPIRKIAERLIDQPDRPLESLQPLVKSLIRPNRTNWRERQVAAWVLGRAPLNDHERAFAAETLSDLLSQQLEMDTSAKLKKTFWRSLPFVFLFAVSLASSGNSDPFPVYLFGGLAWIYPLMLLISTFLWDSESIDIRATAARSLGYLRDPRSLDALAAALYEPTGLRFLIPNPIRAAAAEALLSVLATLTPEYYGQIRAETMQNLCRALSHPNDELVLAVLRAFVHVGDRRALPDVQKLAAGKGRAARDARIRDAASACLPYIQNRIAQEQAPQMLLRAATPPANPSQELLRAASSSSLTDPFELLRAVTREGAPLPDAETELVLEILTSLEQSGDSRALPYVEQIAQNPAIAPRLRQAAEASLPALYARREVERMTFQPYHGEKENETYAEAEARYLQPTPKEPETQQRLRPEA